MKEEQKTLQNLGLVVLSLFLFTSKVFSDPLPIACKLNFSLLADLTDEDLVSGLLKKGGSLGILRSDAKDVITILKRFEDGKKLRLEGEDPQLEVGLDPKVFESSQIQEIFRRQLGIEHSEILKETSSSLADANDRMARNPHYLRRAIPFYKSRRVDHADLPGAKTRDEYSEIEKAYNQNFVESYLNSTYLMYPDQPLTSTAHAIAKLRAGYVLSDSDLKALKVLREEYENLEQLSKNLNRDQQVGKIVHQQIYEFLKDNANEILRQLSKMNTRENEKLFMHIPIINEDGVFELRFLLLKNRSDYSRLLSEYQRRVQEIEQLDNNLIEHAKKYIEIRHLVENFRTYMDLQYSSSDDTLNAETHKELNKLKHDLLDTFSRKDETTPSAGNINYAVNHMKYWGQSGLWLSKSWKKVGKVGASVLLVTGLGLAVQRTSDYFSNIMIENTDRTQLHDKNYWVKKCKHITPVKVSYFGGRQGGDFAIDQVDSCLNRYRDLLLEEFNLQIQTSSLSRDDEEELFMEKYGLWSHVLEEVYLSYRESPSFAARLDILTQQKREYTKQEAYRISTTPTKNTAVNDLEVSNKQYETMKARTDKVVLESAQLVATIKDILSKDDVWKLDIEALHGLYGYNSEDTSEVMATKKQVLEDSNAKITPHLFDLSKTQGILLTELQMLKTEASKTHWSAELREKIGNSIKRVEEEFAQTELTRKELSKKLGQLEWLAVRYAHSGTKRPNITN